MATPQTIWTPKSLATGAKPKIGDQYIGMGRNVLCLRRPFLEISVLLAQMYVLVLILTIPFGVWLLYILFSVISSNPDLLWVGLLIPLSIGGFVLFAAMHLRRLKMSHIYFNRHTQHIYGKEGDQLYEGDWHGVQASPSSFVDATNVGAVRRFRLEMLVPSVRPLPPHRFWQKRMPEGMFLVRLMSNDDADPRTEFVAEVWEYVRTFMAHGPDTLPIPAEPNWWMLPLHRIVLTPREAFRHYVPWFTGEPGEHQGKRWLTLPFWAVLFPLTLSISLCWWALCCLVGIRPLLPPPEAMEGETGPLVTIEMAQRGVRP
ncbi:hypothetical protein [Dyella kyungheensis]|uniref:Uncharacterized protein n=1 Tax=Dyella kyungheensis TaxID=1242174 RepID=A0ABS2JX12_9GAMM|nr:hypothetical protein [Dyella kyungheensis]MBM7123335.1 hypothetical protein [Dyella kyungheensis]